MDIRIERFAEQMQIELIHNQDKGSVFDWKDFDNMIAELEYHKAKMLLAIRGNDKKAVKEYIADTANVLLAIGNLGGLYSEDSFDDDYCSITNQPIFKQIPNSVAHKYNVGSVGGEYSKTKQ